jgi:hypothetical protein
MLEYLLALGCSRNRVGDVWVWGGGDFVRIRVRLRSKASVIYNVQRPGDCVPEAA